MRKIWALVIIGSLLATAGVFAQTRQGRQVQVAQVDPATRAAYDAAFQETLRKPADPTVLVRFAELAVQVGDLEGAISALERLLLIDPDQPRVKLELAALYNRLGSREAARPYAEAVIASAGATTETKQQARELLTEIEQETKRSTFSGDVFAGLQYSTNANSGPGGSVTVAGAPIVPTPDVSGTPDFAFVAGGTLQHRYDLGAQDNAALETILAVYGTRQFKVSTANVFLVDLVTGPRFSLFDTDDGISARPLLSGRYVAVHDQPTYWSYGTGLEVAKQLTASTRGAVTFLGRRREFQNNADNPTNSQSSGSEMDGIFDLRSVLTPWLTMQGALNITRYTAVVTSESYWERGAGFSAVFKFADPLGFNGLPWTVTVGGSVLFSNYDAPDPTVDPTTVRTQLTLGGNLIATVPLTERASLVGQITYTNQAASISNYAYNAATALLGIGWRF